MGQIASAYLGGTGANEVDPEGNLTVYKSEGNQTYSINGSGTGPGVTYYISYYDVGTSFYAGQSALVRSIVKAYGTSCGFSLWHLKPCSITTTYNDVSPALSKVEVFQYDASGAGNVTLDQEQDFSGNVVRTTTTSWEHGGIYDIPAAGGSGLSNILDKIQSETVTDNIQGKSTTIANTYDAVGNPTSVTTSGTNAGSYETQYLGAISNYGSPTTIKDALGHPTILEYGDSWHDSTCAPASNSNAYVTQSTDPMGLVTKYSYYSCTGLLATITDPNNQTTTFDYDQLGRVLHKYNPAPFGETDISYTDTAPLKIAVSKTIDPSGEEYATNTIFDGFGKPVTSQVTSDTNGILETDTCYDAMGNKAAVSNPYYASGGGPAPTCNESGVGYTRYSYLNGGTYDPFGRVQTITHRDGSTTSFQYAGVTTKETDEGNGTTSVQKIIHDDAFGRPVAVCGLTSATDAAGNSPSSCQQTLSGGQAAIAIAGAGFLTTYSYDGFGNLTGVTQGNVDRTFTYDGLSRLLTADNPETGTTTYVYLQSGALCASSPDSVCSKTDARSSKITYGYNFDNQLTSKIYSDGVTPSVAYTYGPVGTEANNQVGRLTSESTTEGSTVQSQTNIGAYDAMGRVTTETQCIFGSCSSPLTDAWDDLSNIASETNGISNPGVQITYSRDGALRLNTVSSTWQDATHPGTLFSAPSTSYGPYGLLSANYALNSSTQQPGITLARTYDPLRMWVTSDTYNGQVEHSATSGFGTLSITGSEQSKGSTHATGSLTISGSEQNKQKQTKAATQSTGTIALSAHLSSGADQSVVVGATAATAGYATISIMGTSSGMYSMSDWVAINGVYVYFTIPSGTVSANTAASIMANAINASSAPATAQAYNNYVYVTAKTTGASTNYSLATGGTTSGLSYNTPSSLSGGSNGSPGTTVYDSGTFTASLNGCSGSYNWGQSDTVSTISSGLATALNGSCGSLITASASGSGLSLTSKSTGTAVNWALTMSGSYDSSQFSSASFTGSSSGMTGGANAVDTTVYDSGTVVATVDGYSKSTSFGQNDTTSTIATNLAVAINADGSEPVTASASGATITLTTKQTGTSVNYSLASSDTYDSTDFTQSSFTASPSGSSLTGGTGTVQSTVYDSGTVSLTIDGTQETVSYGQSDTPSTIASKLVSSFAGSSAVSVTNPSGASLHIAAKTTGSSTNYSYSVAGSYDSSDFSAPSFGGSPSTGNLSGGTNASSSSGVVYSYSIPSGTGYAPDGNVIGVSDFVMGDWAFSYDAQNRLSSALAGSGPYNTLNLAWSYDRYGNRWGQTATGNPPTGIAEPAPPHFTSNGNPGGNVNNHVDGDTYDAAGDVTIDSLNQYAYDGDGRLCAAYSGNGVYTEYIYNAEGNRVAKGSASNLSCNPASDGFALTNRYIIDPTGRQLSETDGSGNWLHTNVFAGGKLLATYSSSNTYFALTDWLGTKRVETDSAGHSVSTSYSLPFGDNLVVDGSPDATEHHFTSKEHDSATGNDYFLARYYNSATGRFLSPDWSKNPEGVPYADFTDPQSLDLYSYVGNNPISNTDRDGHCNSLSGTGCSLSGGPQCYCSEPKDASGNRVAPVVPVPGGAPDTKWEWHSDNRNSRKGTWGPDKWDRKTQGNPPSASWDDNPGKGGVEHWDVKSGGRGKQHTDRYDKDGNYLTPGQAHGKDPIPFSIEVDTGVIIGAIYTYSHFRRGLDNFGDTLRNLSPPSFPANSGMNGGMTPPPPPPPWVFVF